MKLSEMSSNSFIKLLVYGDSGTGKTVLAASFAEQGPVEYWDFDHKISSAANFYHNKPEILKNIDVYQFAHLPKETRMSEWQKRAHQIDTLVRAKQPLPFKTLVLDSLTTFTQYMLENYITNNKSIKRPLEGINAMQDYQLLDKHLTQIISSLLALDCNVVMLGHLQTEKDEVSGLVSRRPLMAGKFADKLPIYFEEVYVSKVDSAGKYVLQTRTDSNFKCRTQRNLPATIESHCKNIK